MYNFPLFFFPFSRSGSCDDSSYFTWMYSKHLQVLWPRKQGCCISTSFKQEEQVKTSDPAKSLLMWNWGRGGASWERRRVQRHPRSCRAFQTHAQVRSSARSEDDYKPTDENFRFHFLIFTSRYVEQLVVRGCLWCHWLLIWGFSSQFSPCFRHQLLLFYLANLSEVWLLAHQ